MTADQQRKFEEDVKPWRDYAEVLGLDLAAFDAGIAERKSTFERKLEELKAEFPKLTEFPTLPPHP